MLPVFLPWCLVQQDSRLESVDELQFAICNSTSTLPSSCYFGIFYVENMYDQETFPLHSYLWAELPYPWHTWRIGLDGSK